MSHIDNTFSFPLLFEECFFFVERLQDIIDKNPDDKLSITNIVTLFKEFLITKSDLMMIKQCFCQDFEHSKLLLFLEDSKKKMFDLSEAIKNLKVEKEEIQKALKVKFCFYIIVNFFLYL